MIDDDFIFTFTITGIIFLVLAIPLSIYKHDLGYVSLSFLYALIISGLNSYLEK